MTGGWRETRTEPQHLARALLDVLTSLWISAPCRDFVERPLVRPELDSRAGAVCVRVGRLEEEQLDGDVRVMADL